MASLEDRSIWDDTEALEDIGQEILRSSTDDIIARGRLLENDVRIMNSEFKRLTHEQTHMHEKIKENREKIKLNRQLPYLVGNVVELLDASVVCGDDDEDENMVDEYFMDQDGIDSKNTNGESGEADDDDDDIDADADADTGVGADNKRKQEDVEKGANGDAVVAKPSSCRKQATKMANKKKGFLNNSGGGGDADSRKAAVVKTSTRQTIFLPMAGLVSPSELKPGDLVGVNKDSYLILDKLPPEYDARVKAMEVDEKPTEDYGDIGGLDKQIEELVEAIVLPMTQQERFDRLGIKSPKGVLMYGPPGTGKTLLARACAAQTQSTFLKLAGPQLVQMFIGDGAKLVRDAFALAREKQPTIIFIDEIDAVGTKRFDSEKSGDREVQRTMLELLNQLDGFSSSDKIKVIAATNRIDILDPALLRSGRLDRKIEFPHPNEEGRARIMQIHSRKMTVSPDVNFDELARSCDEFNGAQCKAICVEAGMIALRRNATTITHEDFMEGILEVQAKKKTVLQYYA